MFMRRLQKVYTMKWKKLCVVADLEKAFERMPHMVMRSVLEALDRVVMGFQCDR